MKLTNFAELFARPLEVLVRLPISIVVAIFYRLTRVDRNWWHETPGYKFYYDRPDYRRYQAARKLIGKYRLTEGLLLKLRAI